MHPLPRNMSSAERHAWDLLRPAAERGLLKGPVHLVFGPSALGDCLSPYCRDLREILESWADKQKIAVPTLHPENRIYSAAQSFCQSQPHPELERRSQEQLVGISRFAIDTRRLDRAAMDERIDPESLKPFDSVFVLLETLNPGMAPDTALAVVHILKDLLRTIAIACPKEKESERFMASLREEHVLPVHLLDTHEQRSHSSACRYLNNLREPTTPEPPKAQKTPEAKQAPLPKTPAPGRYLRIKA